MSLSVDQVHLLKRELLRLAIADESARLDNMNNINQLGPPFIDTDGMPADGSAFPIMSYILVNFVVPFPPLARADAKFWANTAQPFIQGLASKEISSSADRDEATKRRRLGRIAKRFILMLMVAGISTNVPNESRRYSKRRAYDAILPKTDDGILDKQPGTPQDAEIANGTPPPGPVPGLIATVIGAYTGSSTRLLKNKETHYILEAQMWGGPPVWTKRTYLDFVALDKRLMKEFPGKHLARLPHKNSTNTVVKVDGSERTLIRERQRVTLRAYLNRLTSIPKVCQSDIFLEFLFKQRVNELTKEEIADIVVRQGLDRERWTNREKFYDLANERAKKLEQYLGEIKSEILMDDALPKLFMEMKTHSRVEDMSPLLQKFVEWCLVEFSGIIYNLLLGRDDSPEIFSQVKRFYHLMPFKLMQGILKLSNPALIMKKLTDLFMATPFGGKSLLQNMFIRILNDDMRSQEVLLEELEKSISNHALTKPLKDYSQMGYHEREQIHYQVDHSNKDIVLVIYENSDIDPKLLRITTKYHDLWQKAVEHPETIDDNVEKIDTYSQLKDFLKLSVRQRDKDIMKDFWADPGTIAFVRATVDILYDILIEIFRTGKIAESLGDFERFASDIINFVDAADGGIALDANELVNGLIAICQKHQNSVFRFINRVYSREDSIFVDMISWMTLFINFIRDGKQNKYRIDLFGIVDRASENGMDISVLQSDLDTLQQWLRNRQETAKPDLKGAPTEKMGEASDYLEDIGLTWDDVGFAMAEVEIDEQEEFIPELNTDMAQDAVTRERFRRFKHSEMERRKEEMKDRPASRLIEELVPAFQEALGKVLSEARVYPTPMSNYK
ncbi:hypothetical protein B9G98_00049 [Wickerhamiella sorbophila]|uniref:PX domain-containing protein n=1 Tax=Wickerhamiella sorbophila TaxID=45607 RepID=A0A2T0FBW3_9ASCO|nr:hypothetical protein B9G98_00049 [Wickerhamiella sorbophila]PRT52429.1 hypothetical protein B9G98_00049 [Wickerhamiella sorbophila]